MPRAASTPLEIIFIPIASPVEVAKRTKSVRPAKTVCSDARRAKRDVLSNADLIELAPCAESIQRLARAALVRDGNSITGPRVMASWVSTVVTPPFAFRTLHPRLVDATRVPSVVAMGIGVIRPSIIRGPAIPNGSGM